MELRPRGGMPRYSTRHVWLALHELRRESPLGRKDLALKLDLGEGSVRSILDLLRRNGMIRTTRAGVFLEDAGEKVLEDLGIELAEFRCGAFESTFCLIVRSAGHVIKYGIEERDAAVRGGANGALTLFMSEGRLMMPGPDGAIPVEDLYPDCTDLKVDLEDGDVVIIPLGENALEGGIEAALDLAERAGRSFDRYFK